MLLPQKCTECKKFKDYFFCMGKNEKVKLEICIECKENLEKEGWKVLAEGRY